MNNLIAQTNCIIIQGMGIKQLEPGQVYCISEDGRPDTKGYRLKIDNQNRKFT